MNSSLGHSVVLTSGTLDGALCKLQGYAMCSVRKSVFPTFTRTEYYVSECGDVFGLRYLGGKYNIYPIAYRKNQSGKICYNLATRKGAHTQLNADKIVYCTFVLNYWKEHIKITYKDGDVDNIHYTNLQEKEDPCELIGLIMADYADIYNKWFNYVRDYTAYKLYLNKQDAEDITQDAFVSLMQKDPSCIDNFVSAWCVRSKSLAIRFKQSQDKCILVDNDDLFRCAGDIYSIDILSLIKDSKKRSVMRQYITGYGAEYIADVYGCDKSNIYHIISKEVSKLRTALQGEVKYLLG